MALVPIYQYRNGMGFLRYFYTTLASMSSQNSSPPFNSVPRDDVANWTNGTPDGVAFYGCAATDPGAVAVYQYSASVPSSYGQPGDACYYFYSMLSGIPYAGTGWNQSSPNPAFYVYGAPDCGLAQVTMWYIENPNWSFFWGCNPQSAMIGNFVAQSGWLPVGWSTAPGLDNQPFYALPGSVELAYSIQNLDLGQVPDDSASPLLAGTEYITNDSESATISQLVSVSKTLTFTMTFSFTETLAVADAVECSFSVPGIGSVKNTATVTLTLSATQQVAWSTTQSVTITSTVNVPTQKSVTVDVYVNVADNVPVPLTLTVIVSPESNGVSLVQAGPCTALTQLFNDQNPNWSGAAPQPASGGVQGIVVTLNGTVTCSFAVTTDVQVTDGTSDTTSSRVEKFKAAKAAKAARALKAKA